MNTSDPSIQATPQSSVETLGEAPPLQNTEQTHSFIDVGIRDSLFSSSYMNEWDSGISPSGNEKNFQNPKEEPEEELFSAQFTRQFQTEIGAEEELFSTQAMERSGQSANLLPPSLNRQRLTQNLVKDKDTIMADCDSLVSIW